MGDARETRLISPRQLKARIEAESTGIPFLHWLDADNEQHILLLTHDRGRVTIGRRAHCDVPLTWDQEVSREHALLEPVGEDWTLVDDGLSRNGSFVNGDRITGRHRLSSRDRMCFGNTYVSYHAPTTTEESESTARPQGATGQIPLTDIQKKLLIALCRPIVEATSTTPATNPQIADEVHMSIDRVKAHMRDLFARFGLGDLPQNEKRNRLVVMVLSSGLLAKHDF